jgi:hypothetical protein
LGALVTYGQAFGCCPRVRFRVTGVRYIGGVCSEESFAAVGVILSVRPQGLAPGELADGLRRLAVLAARVEAHRAEFICEAERCDAARREGFGSTTAWLMVLSGDPAPVCRSRVAVAASLQEMPETKKAFASGEVSESRVRLLAQAQALAPEQFAQDEAKLVAEAASVPARRLPQVLAVWKRNADLPAAEAEAERLHAQRALHVSPDWSGMVRVNGLLDPEGGGIVLAAIRGLSEPAALDADDPRTPTQRQADAFVEICHRYLRGGSGKGSSRPQLTVTIPWNTLQTGMGVVDTAAGPITGQTARRLACDATISRIICQQDGSPVEAGEARRVIPPALRRAVDLRDQGCTHPGCDVPARWCDAHHIVHWADGGKTEISNLRLLCRTHHGQQHDHHHPRRQ